jgi:hypothetical protein
MRFRVLACSRIYLEDAVRHRRKWRVHGTAVATDPTGSEYMTLSFIHHIRLPVVRKTAHITDNRAFSVTEKGKCR